MASEPLGFREQLLADQLTPVFRDWFIRHMHDIDVVETDTAPIEPEPVEIISTEVPWYLMDDITESAARHGIDVQEWMMRAIHVHIGWLDAEWRHKVESDRQLRASPLQPVETQLSGTNNRKKS